MVVTRSMSQNPDTTENAAERREDPAEVARKVVAKRIHTLFGGPINNAKIVARPKSIGKYYDLDERILAMGIFIDTVKEERLKNDPDFTFTMEFYRATMHDFNSLSDDNKAVYIAEAKKRNSIEDKAVATKWVAEEELMIDVVENDKLEAKACGLYHDAVEAERRKNTGKSDGPVRKGYFAALKTAEDRCPYLAEATVRQLEEHAKAVKEAVKELDAWL